MRDQEPARAVIRPGVALLWIPLGAGARVPVVRCNGLAFEAVAAWREKRPRQGLFHAALEVGAGSGGFVVEMTRPGEPATSARAPSRPARSG